MKKKDKKAVVIVAILMISVFVGLFFSASAAAEEGLTPHQEGINKAIDKGLDYLRKSQGDDGSWNPAGGHKVGATSMGALCFLEHGIGESDPTVSKAINYIIRNVKDDGSIYSTGKPTYETSLAIMALAYTENPDYKDEIKNARDWLVKNQYTQETKYKGGWHYGANPSYADLSNTQFVLVGLKVAELPLTDATWSKAETFVSACQNPDGGVTYKPNYGSSYGSMTAAGIWGLRLCDVQTTDNRIQNALKWFDKNYDYKTNPAKGGEWLYYYMWTAAKAFLICDITGDITDRFGLMTPEDPADEKGWYYDFSSYLIENQNDDGSWSGTGGLAGAILNTEWAILVLEKAVGIKPTPTPAPTQAPTPTPAPVITTPTPPVTAGVPQITISQTSLLEEPEVGEEAVITVTLRNAGDGIAKNIQLTERIPSSVSISYVDGADKAGNLVIWTGDLNPRESHSIQHTFRILEIKDRFFTARVTFEDAAGNKRETSTEIYIMTEVPTPIPTPMPTPTPPGFEAVFAIAGLLAVAYLLKRRK